MVNYTQNYLRVDLRNFYLFYKSHEPKKRKRSTASPDLALVCTFMTENLPLMCPVERRQSFGDKLDKYNV